MDLIDIIHEIEKLREYVRGAYLASGEDGMMETVLYALRDDIDTLLLKLYPKDFPFASND